MKLLPTYLNEFNRNAERVLNYINYGDQPRALHALQACRLNLILFIEGGGSMFTADDEGNVQPTRALKLFEHCTDVVKAATT